MLSVNKDKSIAASMILAFAIVASSAVVFLFVSQNTVYKLSLVAAIAFPIVLYFSGNHRLFFLFGLILTSPLGLSINFMLVIHTGGSPSFSIDLPDVFLIPLVLFLLRDLALGYRRKLVFPSITYWWIGLILLGFVSIVFGPLPRLSSFETLRMVKGVLIFIVIINECRRVRQFEFVVFALGLGMLLQVAIGFMQYYLKSDLGLQVLGEGGTDSVAGANLGVYGELDAVYRIGGLMGHPNLLSAYLALLLPIFIALMFTNYNKLIKLAITGLLSASLLALVLTLSRSGWISFAIAFGLLLIFVSTERYFRLRFLALKGFLVAVTSVIFLVASGPIIQRLTQSDSGSFDFRLEWMVVAMDMVLAKPVLGFGLNTFIYEVVPFTPEQSVAALLDRFGEIWPVVHNIYLIVWTEQGTLGLLLFLGFHIHLFRIAISNVRYKLDSKLHALNIGAACGILALMVDGLASFFIRVPACGRMFWIVAAIIVAINYWNKNNYSYRKRLAQSKMAENVPATQ